MSFDTPRYVLFLAAAVFLHRLCPAQWRWALLLIGSLFFYACWSAPLTLVIVGVILLTWAAGLMMEKSGTKRAKRLWLALSVLCCVGLLIWFKYFNFLADAFVRLAGGRWEPLRLLLPVGCSFYTFQAMSYVFDVYRGTIPAVRHPGHYALFIAFFPQLVAGPIERTDSLLPQLIAARTADREDVKAGLMLLLSGFFRKLVIADLAAPAVDRVFAAPSPDGSAVLLALILCSFQIYCDFAGYSEIAQGSARLLGIRIRRNFDRPYLAQTVRGFWRRWHISLTGWFTDYVYIPLGGNRKGRGRQVLATFVVFLLSGLWHGANWTFVLWGAFHGLLCAVEVLMNRREIAEPGVRRHIQWVLTAVPVLLSWLLFRAESLGQAAAFAVRLFSAWDVRAGLSLLGLTWAQAAAFLLGLSYLPMLHRLSQGRRISAMACFFLAVCILLAWFARAAGHGAGAFIYFQF